MVGAAGFVLVMAVGMWLEKPLPVAFIAALMAAVGFALFCQLWTQLLLMSYRQALLEQQPQAASAPATPAPTGPAVLLPPRKMIARRSRSK